MTARWTLGIDPGKTGAAVLLDGDGRIACLAVPASAMFIATAPRSNRR